jgi:DNA-binding response OmpR family regulator
MMRSDPLLAAPTGKRILVVDDETSIVRLLKVNLERQGFRVDTAENGAQAFACLAAGSHDLLITDIMMPEMDGMELIEAVRQDPDLRDLPIVLLTQKSDERDVLAGYTRGADMYLNKPFNPAELNLVVRRLLLPGGPADETLPKNSTGEQPANAGTNTATPS